MATNGEPVAMHDQLCLRSISHATPANPRTACAQVAQLDSPLTEPVHQPAFRINRSVGTLQNKLSALSFRFKWGDFFSENARLVRTNAYNRFRSDRSHVTVGKNCAT